MSMAAILKTICLRDLERVARGLRKKIFETVRICNFRVEKRTSMPEFWLCARHSRSQRPRSFCQDQELRPLGRSDFLSTCRVIVWFSQPARFVRLDSVHAQSDGKSVNRGFPVLDLPRGRDCWSWPKRSAASGDENVRQAPSLKK